MRFDLLRICKSPIIVTRLFSIARINYQDCKKHLLFLHSAGLISRIQLNQMDSWGNPRYAFQVTNKGKEFLEQYADGFDLLGSNLKTKKMIEVTPF